MIEKVMEIVREASDLFKNKEFTVLSKGSASNQVTSVDLSVQEFLKERLTPLIENCGFIGEESEVDDYDHDYLWIVDPIDGTSNFIRDIGLSVISVGLVKDGVPVLGVVYHPYRDEMFYAEQGKGAYVNGRPMKVSDHDLSHSLFCTAMSLYNKDLAGSCFRIIEKVYEDCDDIRRLGSAALELAYLAAGRVDLYFEMRVFPWDFAAGEVLIREAGGYVGTVEFDRTVFTRPIPLICANSRENYDYLKRVVTDEVPKIPYDQ
ncbi:inositol monophosphatase family protein [Paenibacillus sp. NPDC057967]|uniref:inositol monophosphatase family protein n=1 Tax=Paenibacillus sp. NPDC057967 TaxID=3346293 RepID=UPI0036D79C2A